MNQQMFPCPLCQGGAKPNPEMYEGRELSCALCRGKHSVPRKKVEDYFSDEGTAQACRDYIQKHQNSQKP